MRPAVAALTAVFLAAHLPLLPPALDDIDAINFALGVRDFDVARHQPHPPGYPVFIALAKASSAAMRATGISEPEARGLALLSVLSGAALVVLLVALFRAVDGDERRAWWTALVAVTAPTFWFTALRPLSDMSGLAFAVAAQAPLAAVLCGRAAGRALVGGAFLAGLAIGVRSQTFVLTLPLLAVALAAARQVRLPERLAALAAFAAGVLVWGIPLVAASGGLTGYAVALGAQAGEDFAGVEMLYLARSPRVLADALLHSFIWPWGSLAVGSVVLFAAGAGLVRAAWRLPRPLAVLAVAFGPYAVFHLLFQEVQMVRYALPLVPPVAYLAVSGLEWGGTRVRMLGASALAAVFLVLTVPATLVYGRQPGPAMRLLSDAAQSVDAAAPPEQVDFAYHGIFRRAVQWTGNGEYGRLVKAPPGREWLSLLTAFRTGTSQVLLAADERRTDLALFDPNAVARLGTYGWGFVEPPFVGGARPGRSSLYRITSPRWMLDRGWALTAEVGGVSARDGRGPHIMPSVAWIRGRGPMTVMLGGRHLGADGDPPAKVEVRFAGERLDAFDAAPGYFFRVIQRPSAVSARGYQPLEVSASGGPRVSLEQFDAQGPGVPMVGYRDGWYEPEFNPATGRAWRWMSPKATLWIRPTGRDVVLRIAGEDPLRYFDRAPEVVIRAAGRELARFQPAGDFTRLVPIPAAALAEADGVVEMTSDLHFVPGDQDGTGDRRPLALRIYAVTLTPAIGSSVHRPSVHRGMPIGAARLGR